MAGADSPVAPDLPLPLDRIACNFDGVKNNDAVHNLQQRKIKQDLLKVGDCVGLFKKLCLIQGDKNKLLSW